MKCSPHNLEAVAVCTYCGRALCAKCAKPSVGRRLVCTEECAAALAQNEKAMQLILQKSLQSARASALYSFLCAALSAGGALGAKKYLPSPFLIWFCAGCALVFVASGIWYAAIARKQNPKD